MAEEKDIKKEEGGEEVKAPSQQEQLRNILSKVKDNDYKMYFFVLDTKGNASAGVAYIYEHVKTLRDLGYDAYILHEDHEYHGVQDWLGKEYMELPHVCIKDQVGINTEDFLFIPEIFSPLMHDLKGFTAKKVVICQNYHYALELINPGTRWQDYGFFDVITTSDQQAKYIKEIMANIRTHTVPVSIPEYFKPTDEMKKPIVAISTRDQVEARRIVKEFYLKYPMYKWVTFKDMRGMSREEFADMLGQACVAVWLDPVAGFGTFPVEAMECDTPVIGKIPNMIPEYMLEEVAPQEEGEQPQVKLRDNGVWTDSQMNLTSLIAEYMKVWLEDQVPPVISENMEKVKGVYTPENQKAKIEEVYGTLVENRKKEISSLLKPVEDKKETE